MRQLNEVARMQQLAGINEIRVNEPKTHFQKWKEGIIEHMTQTCDEDDVYCELIEPFKQIKDPNEAINFLVDNEYLEDNDDDREHNEYFIKNGEFPENDY